MPRLIPALLLLLAGCGPTRVEVRDTPRVERLRMRITKARNAIEETRSAIVRGRGAPYLPELYIRLAELLSEEARYHYQVAYEREQRSDKALHVPQVRFLKEQAVALYTQVVRRYPDSEVVPRALFNTGQEHRELGSYEAMREVLRRLVKGHPKSPLSRSALLVLGDDHFDRNQLREAGREYKRILDAEGPSRVKGLAHYKLAWVHVNLGGCKRALKHFERAILSVQAFVDEGGLLRGAAGGTYADLDVRREALVDLTYCYSRERKPNTAVGYLRARAYDRGAYMAALQRLADRYSVLEQAEGAAAVTRELLAFAPDEPARLEDARLLHASLRKSGDFTRVGADVAAIARAGLRRAHAPETPAETRGRLLDEFERMSRDLATRAHEKAKAKPGDRQRALQVAGAYEAYLEAFPKAPERGAALENLADVLASAGRSFAAGRRALAAADLRGAEDPERGNLLYDAVVHLQAALGKETGRAQLERVVARAGLRRAGAELLARTLPVERARRVEFAVAQTYYDEGRYRQAIDRLTAVAFARPGTTEGDTAVHLVLDSYKTLNDFLGLIQAGYRFLGETSPVSPGVKGEIKPIVAAAEQHQLDELSLAAAGVDGGNAASELESFADRYKGSALGERALLNAFVAARASGDSVALYRLAGEIEARYPKSTQLPGILSTLARTAAARFEVDRAVKLFGRAALANPAERVALLLAAGGLRALLGDPKGAQKALEGAVQAGKTPEARALPGTALATLLERGGQAPTVVAGLTPLRPDGHPEVLARLGLAQVRVGKAEDGEVNLQRVLDAGDGASAEARARAHYGQAEALLPVIANYAPGSDLEAIQEVVTLVEVAEQSYLKAAREGSRSVTAAALARLAHLSLSAAQKLRGLQPAGAQAEAIKKGLERRAKSLETTAAEALKTCAEQAWTHHLFTVAARQCLANEAPAKDPLSFDPIAARRPATASAELDSLRLKLSRNPEDLEALRELGARLLEGGDAHLARLVLSRAVRTGGGPLEQNLLGIAGHRIGDLAGALEGFSRAAEGGLEAGRQNLASALRGAGLAAAGEAALKRHGAGRPGGPLLSPGVN